MIRLTRINHKPLVVNSDLIEHIDATPDTVIGMTGGEKLVVLESAEEVIARVVEFRRSVAKGTQVCCECLRRELLQHAVSQHDAERPGSEPGEAG
jgi:flagellar protein FlbD